MNEEATVLISWRELKQIDAAICEPANSALWNRARVTVNKIAKRFYDADESADASR